MKGYGAWWLRHLQETNHTWASRQVFLHKSELKEILVIQEWDGKLVPWSKKEDDSMVMEVVIKLS
jgi:hypothetical protein